jgi:hypothetical protein
MIRPSSMVVCTLALLAGASRADARSDLAIEHVTVIDVTADSAADARLPDRTVWIENDSIVAVGASGEISLPPDCEILDGRGKLLVPGFFENRGVDLIKTYNSILREAFFGLVEEARKLDLDVAGHLPRGVSPQEAAEAGMRSIEHARFPALACGEDYDDWRVAFDRWTRLEGDDVGDAYLRLRLRLMETFDEVLAEEIAFALADHDVTLVPTHTTRKMDALADDPEYRSDPCRKYIPGVALANWDADLDNLASEPPPAREYYREFFELGLEVTGIAHRSGVRVLVGTDAPDTHCFPGFSYHDEMEHLVDAGMRPFEVLQAATIRAAEFLRIADRFGAVAAGQAADLLLLDADPSAAIGNTRSIAALILRGEAFDRAALDAKLEAVEQFVASR